MKEQGKLIMEIDKKPNSVFIKTESKIFSQSCKIEETGA